MPHIDGRSGEVVIRIVYDGSPEAGKTTNVQQLGHLISLQRRGAAKSPGTHGDRTEFFDWLDFSGGYLDGRRVRCQLVSVPGQSRLLHRRRYLLETADVVVFVADSRVPAFADAAESFGTTVRIAARVAGEVPLGIIVQANKQDLDGARPPEEVARALGAAESVPVVGSAAASGEGVMQTFVLAVRLATDRVRTLMLANTLADLPTSDETPDALHAAMVEVDAAVRAEAERLEAERLEAERLEAERLEAERLEAERLDAERRASEAFSPPDPALTEVVVVDFDIEEGEAPPPPARGRPNRLLALDPIALPQGHELGAGHVWPPTRGRGSFVSATSGPLHLPDQLQPWAPDDGWEIATDDWLLHSSERWRFDSEPEARLHLIGIVRRLAPLADRLPDGRALAIARDGAGWRLWMVTPRLGTARADDGNTVLLSLDEVLA